MNNIEDIKSNDIVEVFKGDGSIYYYVISRVDNRGIHLAFIIKKGDELNFKHTSGLMGYSIDGMWRILDEEEKKNLSRRVLNKIIKERDLDAKVVDNEYVMEKYITISPGYKFVYMGSIVYNKNGKKEGYAFNNEYGIITI